jgi:hypothetical protein
MEIALLKVNTEIVDENVELKSYESNCDGFIESWRERYGADASNLQQLMIAAWEKDRKHFE